MTNKQCCGRLPNGEGWGHSGPCHIEREEVKECRCECHNPMSKFDKCSMCESHHPRLQSEPKDWEKMWDISNGRTLCRDCHTKTHTWGVKKPQTKNDIIEKVEGMKKIAYRETGYKLTQEQMGFNRGLNRVKTLLNTPRAGRIIDAFEKPNIKGKDGYMKAWFNIK